MNEKEMQKISKFLSLILRHSPEVIGLKLDKSGWADVLELQQKSLKKNMQFTLKMLDEVVKTNNKKRFSFNEDKTKIRANQGHSLKNVDVELKEQVPPEFLYHGTVEKFMGAIKEGGLKKMSRQHVHLSQERETAEAVGSRRGKPTILVVKSLAMHQAGFTFYLSENGVWLVDSVPVEFIEFGV